MFSKIKKFHRANEHALFGGVCAGIAYTLGIPVWIIRIIIFLSIFTSFFPYHPGSFILPTYFLVWVFVPGYESDPKNFDKVTSGRNTQRA